MLLPPVEILMIKTSLKHVFINFFIHLSLKRSLRRHLRAEKLFGTSAKRKLLFFHHHNCRQVESVGCYWNWVLWFKKKK